MKKTLEDLLKFNFLSANRIANSDSSKHDKFVYALKKVKAKIEKPINDYTEELNDIKVDLASVDKDNNLIINTHGSFSYTPENYKLITKKQNQLFETKKDNLYTIEPHYATYIPSDLSDDEIECYCGFVITEDQANELLNKEVEIIEEI